MSIEKGAGTGLGQRGGTMSSTQTDLERQVWDLTKRVFEIERHVGLRGATTATMEQAAPVAVVPPVAISPPVAPPVAALGPVHAGPSVSRPPVTAIFERATAGMAGAGVAGTGQPRVGHAGRLSVEQLVGGKLFAAIGAIVLVIGIGLALKLGVDRGWFSMSPAMRCMSSTLLGVAMLVGGQLVRRRWGVFASVGLTSAGVGTMFVSVLAAYGWYGLLPAPVAFAALVCVCAVGIGVSLSCSSLAVAALAMVCAYATPLTMGDSGGPAAVVPVYLLGLLAVGLVLAGWRPDVFRALRTVSWWGTVVVGTIWLFTVGKGSPMLALSFLGVFWLGVHAELVLGPRRLSEGKATMAAGAGGLRGRARLARPLLGSMSTTVWSVGMGILLLQVVGVASLPMWMVPCAGTIGTMALGMILAGTLRALVDAPTTDLQRLGAGLRVQAGGLAVVTLALGLSGWTMAVAWLGMGVASVVAGRWVRLRGLDVYGVVLLLLATGRLIVWDSWNAGGTGTEVLGLVLGRWSVLMVAGGLAWLTTAWVLSRGREMAGRWSWIVGGCVGLSAVCVMGSLLVQKTSLEVVVIAWALLSLAYAAGSRLGRAGPTAWVWVLAAGATSVLWMGVFLLDKDWWSYGGAAMSHPGFWTGLMVAGVWVIGPLLSRLTGAGGSEVDAGDKRAAMLMRAIGGGVLLLASSLEIARSAEVLVPGDTTVHRAAVSVWWAVFGVGLIVLGFARRVPMVRHAGLVLMAVATFKGVIFDLAGVSAEWRVVTFLGLGAMMLGVAVVYAKVSARAGREMAARE